MHFLGFVAMRMGRSSNPALDIAVFMVPCPSLNFGSGDQVICSTEGSLLVFVGFCKALT